MSNVISNFVMIRFCRRFSLVVNHLLTTETFIYNILKLPPYFIVFFNNYLSLTKKILVLALSEFLT